MKGYYALTLYMTYLDEIDERREADGQVRADRVRESGQETGRYGVDGSILAKVSIQEVDG